MVWGEHHCHRQSAVLVRVQLVRVQLVRYQDHSICDVAGREGVCEVNPSRPRDQYSSSQDGPSEWPHETPTQPRYRSSGEPPLTPRQPLTSPSSPLYTPRAPGSRPAYRAGRHPYDPPNQVPGWPAAPNYGEPEQRPQRPDSILDLSTLTIADWLILGGGLLTLLGPFLPWLPVSR